MPSQRTIKGPPSLWAESFGDPARPAVLLIMGAGAQAIGPAPSPKVTVVKRRMQ